MVYFTISSLRLKPSAHVGVVDAYGPTSEHGTPPDLLCAANSEP
jgi:hypothetical protein